MKKIFTLAIVGVFFLSSCSKKASTDTAAVTAPVALKADFTVANPTQIKEGTAVQFTNTSTGAVSYSWNFGNGRSSTEKSPLVTFPACGILTIKLTATDAKGNTTVSAQEYTINCIFNNANHPPLF